MSKLRSCLGRAGLEPAAALCAVDNCYQFNAPPQTWIDHEILFDSIHQAEAALREGDIQSAYGPSAVAWAISRRSFLPGTESSWVEQRRATIRAALVRALECRSLIYLRNREFPLAAQAARDAIAAEPFRESSYCLLMQAEAAAGNKAEAIRVYEQCRKLIRDELGVTPSQDTTAVLEAIIANPQ